MHITEKRQVPDCTQTPAPQAWHTGAGVWERQPVGAHTTQSEQGAMSSGNFNFMLPQKSEGWQEETKAMGKDLRNL